MDANKIWMLKDFVGHNKVLFKIPVYQRNYDWSENNCIRLLTDIRKIITNDSKHFLGAVVFMADKSGGFSLQEYIIIDGQQRLTTIMLMLKALSDVSEGIDNEIAEEIEEEYLHNKRCEEEFKIKLKPIKSDNNQFQYLLKNKIDEMDEETHIYKNYSKCKETFEMWIKNGIKPSEILRAMSKLEIVEIILTKGEDDPQIIFESINSTGLELTNADLIRNFLLMSAEDQDRLYEDYWLYIEKNLKKGVDYSNLDLFFNQYVIYKTTSTFSSKNLYEKFVKLFEEGEYTNETILKEIKYFSEIFKAFVYGDKKYSDKVNKALDRIRLLKQTTCYPFLFHVFDDYHKMVIDEKTLEKTLDFLVAYLLRRIVCGVPSNSLRAMFIYLYNRTFKVTENKGKYYESINKLLHTVISKDTVPTEKDFKNHLETTNIYSNTTLCKFLLLDIENGDSKETLISDKLTVEHIMPQSLNADWKHISVEDHEEHLHTLGNLSVTGYNSELSNKSFANKKKIIKENSKAIILNGDILTQNNWGVDEIKERSKRLGKIILERYEIQKISDPSIEFEYLTEVKLDDYDEVTGKKLVSFVFEDGIYRQNKYIVMLADVIKLIKEKNPDKFRELVKSGYCFNSSNKHIHLALTGEGMRSKWNIFDDVYIEANLSAFGCVAFIDSLISEFGLSEDIFKLYVVAEEDDDDNDDE